METIRQWAVFTTLLMLLSAPAMAQGEKRDARQLLDGAKKTLEDFASDPDMTWFRDHIGQAKGVLIVPKLIKGGIGFGASGGRGVLLARGSGGKWSDPAFYTMGGVSWGLQLGLEVSQVVLLVRTQKGMDSLLSTSLKLGGNVGVAAGPVGAGAKVATSDILSFSRSKGVYGGLTLEGAVVKVDGGMNQAFYGRPVTPPDILITRKARNPQADALVKAIARIAEKAKR